MSHIESLLEQIKINYQISDVGNCCYRVQLEWKLIETAVGGKAEILTNKDFRLFFSRGLGAFEGLKKQIVKT